MKDKTTNKEIFTAPQVEIVIFANEDVITESPVAFSGFNGTEDQF